MIKTHYECPCLDLCPLNNAMRVIGGKWKMQIICVLNNKGRTRYNALRRHLGEVSNTVLSKALKELEEAKLIKRYEYLEVPVRVEYETTSKCDDLIHVLDELSEWSEKNIQE